jgi:hypothetical protein
MAKMSLCIGECPSNSPFLKNNGALLLQGLFMPFFFIHGDNKVPFQTVLEIYIYVFIFDRSCVLLKTK